MRLTTLELIDKLVEKAKGAPNTILEYNCDLPDHPAITPNSFFGVKAQYNPMVSKDTRVVMIYKLN